MLMELLGFGDDLVSRKGRKEGGMDGDLAIPSAELAGTPRKPR